MQVLVNMPANFLKSFEKVISGYIWNNGKVRITHRLLCTDKSRGGLRLVDLRKRQMALKTQWVVFIVNDAFWSTLFYSKLKVKIGEEIWSSNLKDKHISLYISEEDNPFWFEVLQAWSEYDFVNPVLKEEILEQPLWHNSLICIDNKPVYFIRAKEAGLVRISQLINERNVIKSHNELLNVYPNCLTWFQYVQLRDAIPRLWKNVLISGNDNHNEMQMKWKKFDVIKNESKISNKVYDEIFRNDVIIIKRKERWERKLNIDITVAQMFRHFSNLYRVTIATKYRDFQYRLLTGTIVTNRLLGLWGMHEDQLCTFCNDATEEEIHLFCECSCIQPLWQGLKQYIEENKRTELPTLSWNNSNIIFNLVHPKPGHAINFLVLIAKQFVYRFRCKNTIPQFQQLINEVEEIYDIEYVIASKRNNIRKHCEKWSALKEIEAPDRQDQQLITHYINNM